MTSSPSAFGSRLRSTGAPLLVVVTAALIWLASLSFQTGATTELDGSWQLALNYAWTHHFVFGRDLVWTYGPWGWLTTIYYYPATFPEKLAWDLLFKALVAILVVRVAVSLTWPRRVLLVAASLLILPLFGDTAPLLLIAGLTLWIVRSPHPPAPTLVTLGGFLGFLSLLKFTFFLMIAGSVGLLFFHFYHRRTGWRWLWLSVTWAASLLAGWRFAGQDLAALPLFVQRSAILAAGYTEAMFVDETPLIFRLGLANALLFLALVWDRSRIDRIPLMLLLTAFGFLAWKHGFVRADGHTLGFFSCMLFAGIGLPLIADRPHPRLRYGSWLLAAFAVAGAATSNPDVMGNLVPLLRYHLADNTRQLFHLGERRAELDRQFAAARTAAALPAIRARVADATVDQFGFEQAFLLLNALDYRPRPVLQGYQTYSGPLAALNDDFYRSAAAPAFTIARLQTIDNRFPALDDAALLPRLIADHDFVLNEKNFLLLERHATAAPLALRPLASGRLRYQIETCALPVSTGTALWARIDTPLSWLGWLRTVLYKPPEITLVITADNALERRFRLIAPAARAGFLLSPLVLDTGELEQLIAAHTGRPVASFRLEMAPEHRIYFLNRARWELSTLGSLTYRATATAQP